MEAELFRDILYSVHLDTLLDSFDCKKPKDFEDYLILLRILAQRQNKNEFNTLSQKALSFANILVGLQDQPQTYGFKGKLNELRFQALTHNRIGARISSLNQVKSNEIQRYCEFKKQYATINPSEKMNYPSGWLREKSTQITLDHTFTASEMEAIVKKDKAFRRLEHIMSAFDEAIHDPEGKKYLERFYIFMQEEHVPVEQFVALSEQNLKRCLELIIPSPELRQEYRPNERFMHPISQKFLQYGYVTEGQLSALSNHEFNKITQRSVAKTIYKGTFSITRALALTDQDIEALEQKEITRLLKKSPRLINRVLTLAKTITKEDIVTHLANEILLTRLGLALIGFLGAYLLVHSWFVSILCMTLGFIAGDTLYFNYHNAPQKTPPTVVRESLAASNPSEDDVFSPVVQNDMPLRHMILNRQQSILSRKNTTETTALTNEDQNEKRPMCKVSV